MSNKINHKLEFESDKSIEELKKETLNYFQIQGFNLTDSSSKFLKFERGSKMKNMVTRNPLKWKSIIEINFEETKILTNFDIDTIHQVVSLKEEKLWEQFIRNYQRTIETGASFIEENEQGIKETKRSQWKYFGYAIMGAVGLGVPGGFLTYLTGIESFVKFGAMMGAIGYVTYRVDKEKKDAKAK